MYWITAILGAVFIVAPFVLGYENNAAAFYSSMAMGIVVLLMSGLEYLKKDKENWEYWVAAITGLTAIAVPFIFGFQNHVSALWTSVILGAMTVVIAGSKIYTNQQTKT